ncbi:MAG: hypothetical protein NPMRD1_20030 [Nitrosopumilales archaeon]|nr:MAG: hypothetical protein NPMRD1_20030 [Nitrosopumilales archaeon]
MVNGSNHNQGVSTNLKKYNSRVNKFQKLDQNKQALLQIQKNVIIFQ